MATVSDDLIRLYTSSDAVALGGHVRRKDISAAEAVEPMPGLTGHQLNSSRDTACRGKVNFTSTVPA